MYQDNVYEVKVNIRTYDIISANTLFYGFMGSRIYRSFEKLVEPSVAGKLADIIEQGESVVLPLVREDGTLINTFAMFAVQRKDAVADIKMVVLEGIWERNKELRRQFSGRNAVLRLYGDCYFEYDVRKNHVRVYTIDRFEQTLFSASLEELEEKLLERVQDQNRTDIEKLITFLREGRDHFAVNVEGDIFNLRKTPFTIIKGCAVYEEDDYLYTVGYIHFASERQSTAAAGKPVRERDYLTGVLTKGEITKLAVSTVDEEKKQNVTIAIVDIDYFKRVNDVYGHMKGDEALKKVASIIKHEIRDAGLVGRFGGDEFLIIFYDAYNMEDMRERLRSIKNGVAATAIKADNGENISLTLSIGCAAYPKDASNYEDLFFLADAALYRAKEKGRNRYIIYDEEKHGSLEELHSAQMKKNSLNSRGNMSPAELVCAMQDKLYTGQEYPVDKLLEDIALNLNIQRVVLYAGKPFRLVGMAGADRLSGKVVEETIDYLDMPELLQAYDETGVLMYNNIQKIENTSMELYEKLDKQQILSFVQIRFRDGDGMTAVLSLEFVKNKMAWNVNHIPYFRLFGKILSEYRLGL